MALRSPLKERSIETEVFLEGIKELKALATEGTIASGQGLKSIRMRDWS